MLKMKKVIRWNVVLPKNRMEIKQTKIVKK